MGVRIIESGMVAHVRNRQLALGEAQEVLTKLVKLADIKKRMDEGKRVSPADKALMKTCNSTWKKAEKVVAELDALSKSKWSRGKV